MGPPLRDTRERRFNCSKPLTKLSLRTSVPVRLGITCLAALQRERGPGGGANWPPSYNRPLSTSGMNPTVLRIVDANLNRAREALRVVEDYARFVLDDGKLCGELKGLRHELAAATAPWADRAILSRDTPGDVGTANSTAWRRW